MAGVDTFSLAAMLPFVLRDGPGLSVGVGVLRDVTTSLFAEFTEKPRQKFLGNVKPQLSTRNKESRPLHQKFRCVVLVCSV